MYFPFDLFGETRLGNLVLPWDCCPYDRVKDDPEEDEDEDMDEDWDEDDDSEWEDEDEWDDEDE